MKNILINGLLAGAASIVVYLILYLINPNLNFDFLIGIVSATVIYLFFLVRAGFQQRKKIGGFLGFGEVFIASIAIYTIATLIAIVFSYIMIKFNPELLEIAKESTLRSQESVFRMSGMSEDQIALAIEETIEKTDPNQYNSLSTNITGWLGSIILFGLPFALIASLITMKKEKNA